MPDRIVRGVCLLVTLAGVALLLAATYSEQWVTSSVRGVYEVPHFVQWWGGPLLSGVALSGVIVRQEGTAFATAAVACCLISSSIVVAFSLPAGWTIGNAFVVMLIGAALVGIAAFGFAEQKVECQCARHARRYAKTVRVEPLPPPSEPAPRFSQQKTEVFKRRWTPTLIPRGAAK